MGIVGDVGTPHLVRVRDGQIAQQIWTHLVRLVRYARPAFGIDARKPALIISRSPLEDLGAYGIIAARDAAPMRFLSDWV